MKVSKLIQLLKTMDQDAIVVHHGSDHSYENVLNVFEDVAELEDGMLFEINTRENVPVTKINIVVVI